MRYHAHAHHHHSRTRLEHDAEGEERQHGQLVAVEQAALRVAEHCKRAGVQQGLEAPLQLLRRQFGRRLLLGQACASVGTRGWGVGGGEADFALPVGLSKQRCMHILGC